MSWARRSAPSRVVARELERALPPGSPEAEDAALLREQARTLAAPSSPASPIRRRRCWARPRACRWAPFSKTLAEPYRGEDLEIAIEVKPDVEGDAMPQVWPRAGTLHGLGNIIENAADFAQSGMHPGALEREPAAHRGGG
ncbi:MAG: hypothetical protein WDM81_15705 [Rhizomicrobium sp.]